MALPRSGSMQKLLQQAVWKKNEFKEVLTGGTKYRWTHRFVIIHLARSRIVTMMPSGICFTDAVTRCFWVVPVIHTNHCECSNKWQIAVPW